MGYDIATTSDVVFDKNINAFEFRLYMAIRSFCNAKGYSEVLNQTLAEKFGTKAKKNKKEEWVYDDSRIKRTIKKLEKHDYLVVQQHVKQGEIYNRNIDRVIWLKEAFQKNADRKARQAYYKEHARPETDFKEFVSYIRSIYKQKTLSILHTDGKTRQYSIREGHLGSSQSLMFGHFGFGYGENEGYTELDAKKSNSIYKILWENRFNLLEDSYYLCIEGLSEEEEKELKRMTALTHKVTAQLIEHKQQGNSNPSPLPREES